MATPEANGSDVIDSTAEEIGTDLQPAPGSTNVALFGTSDPVQVVAEATRVADSLAAVINAKKLYANISGRSHVKVEGWQLLGSMLGVTAVCTETKPVEGGFQATVEARTLDGRVVGRADALCTKSETLWSSRDDYARLSMAQTRATSKALKGPLGFVVSLAGYQTTPAEEMPSDGGGQDEPQPPPAEPPADPLDSERVEKIIGGFKALRLSFHEIGVTLGSCGIDGLRANSAKAVQERVVSLTTEEATALETEIERLVEKDAG